MSITSGLDARWHDPRLSPIERAENLVPLMTLEEKIAQLAGVWVGADADGAGVAPHQADMTGTTPPLDALIGSGLGQLTRPFGTVPVEPAAGARALAASQERIQAANRFGIPAQVHEECLTGLAAWKATVYPAPLSWGAAFDPDLVEEMTGRIGRSMRAAGIHQGLAPVLDVTRDYRWGRTEETIGEDPYLVGTIGAAYVRGLEGAGVVATLKHFAGYSSSRGGRNHAPVSMGARELADVVLPPFEMALRLGGARSVMNSYAEIDGVPAAASAWLFTRLLRDDWGFAGTVVADYFAIRFLERLHGVAGDGVDAAGIALSAGIDVELPTVDTFGAPLVEAVRDGRIAEALIDRALLRVLTQKAELGLLDDDWKPLPDGAGDLTFDDPGNRDLALRLARESVVLLRNTGGILPLRPGQRVALVGPVADDPLAMLGCYSFPVHVGQHHPDHDTGVAIPTLRASLTAVVGELAYAQGCAITGTDTSGFTAAVTAAAASDVCVVAVGDRAGLFGRGTSGEGCDTTGLRLPGVQAELVRAVQATGTPVVLLLLAGRPYPIDVDFDGVAGIVQGFFPGQCGGQALAEILTGAVNPSGRLPVSVPRDAGGLPATYLNPPLGRRTEVSSVDPTPAFGFGHGLSYTTFDWIGDEPGEPVEWPVDGDAAVSVTVRNTGDRAGTEVVQLYLHDPVAQTTRPVVRLIGFTRVALEPGEAARVTFTVPADLTSFAGLDGHRIVEPGEVELRFGRSSTDIAATVRLRITGEERRARHDRRLQPDCAVEGVRP
ncbi:beta-glucosidase [Actinoplanes lobatus]|uniref:Beta-glucosidase n=1 Tax=Actinoplanes lobatus TaxID=113568 RepID=A0A7W7HN78_9ACTN|nr:glycoside hydrolase family 3 N-terminal domain-containing protein [Actinoplanes lobatus]MBB4753657.1 beta-glucosidase [Actinoplanes lobatus]GGN73136.1 beta-glucosidase [Actinoplanes lobatus]GIE44530.1 beta-glucosidase [Actinoplanes lobatus]